VTKPERGVTVSPAGLPRTRKSENPRYRVIGKPAHKGLPMLAIQLILLGLVLAMFGVLWWAMGDPTWPTGPREEADR